MMLELAGHYAAGNGAVGPVLASATANLLVALGDSPERVEQSQRRRRRPRLQVWVG
ncbi:hypothetical protein I552_6647 [Mycobacterium xenopi 3993]|nr:hypothetical protein I552_6647 [Mycobacterium xenopi 3993]